MFGLAAAGRELRALVTGPHVAGQALLVLRTAGNTVTFLITGQDCGWKKSNMQDGRGLEILR